MDARNVKGTKDIFQNEASAFQYVESVMRNIAEIYAYSEARPPMMEYSEVFTRAVGESSDVVRKEMYTFLDKGGRSLTLRPEFTAGIMRLIVQNKLYATCDLPIKLFYDGPVFRYERPQLGRYRQFNQFGVECVGGNSLYQDVEVIALGYTILSTLGFDNVTLKINTLGDDASRLAYKNALKDYFKDKIDSMCEDCKQRYEINPLRILDCKVPEDQEIVKDAPKMMDYISIESKQRFDNVLEELERLEIPFEIDDTLVRGLDYYSETVFEFHYTSKKGMNYGAIGAGGHYDKLLHEMGGPMLPGIGFSFGVERVVSVMQDDGLLDDKTNNVQVYVMPMNENCKSSALNATILLRMNAIVTDINYEGGKIGAMFKRANKKGAKVAVVIGDEEMANGTLIVKNLDTQDQVSVSVDQFLDTVNEILDDHECQCGNKHNGGGCCHRGDC